MVKVSSVLQENSNKIPFLDCNPKATQIACILEAISSTSHRECSYTDAVASQKYAHHENTPSPHFHCKLLQRVIYY